MCKFRLKPLFLLGFSVLFIALSSNYNGMTEIIYTNFFNRLLREKLSFITSYIPFPIGDILTVVFVILIITVILSLFKNLIKTANIFEFLYRLFWGIVNTFCIVVFVYTFMYGLNYHTKPLQQRMIQMYNDKYATQVNVNADNAKVIDVYKVLSQKAVETRKLVKAADENYSVYNLGSLSKQAEEGFRSISDQFPMMAGSYAPAKISLGSSIFSIFGLDARYYILTDEISVNKNVPKVYLPFLVSKYMAYQRGAAREDEAIFYAYLASINNTSPQFKYSGYISALYYILSNLRINDKTDYNYYIVSLNPEVKKDIDSIDRYMQEQGSLSSVKNQIARNFKRINGDIRIDDLDHQVSTLIATYYSLFTY